jgi:hypothetical protein
MKEKQKRLAHNMHEQLLGVAGIKLTTGGLLANS